MRKAGLVLVMVGVLVLGAGCLQFLRGVGGQPAPTAGTPEYTEWQRGQEVGVGVNALPYAGLVTGAVGLVAAMIEIIRRRSAQKSLEALVGAVNDGKHALDAPQARAFLTALADRLDKEGKRAYVHQIYRMLYPEPETPGK